MMMNVFRKICLLVVGISVGIFSMEAMASCYIAGSSTINESSSNNIYRVMCQAIGSPTAVNVSGYSDTSFELSNNATGSYYAPGNYYRVTPKKIVGYPVDASGVPAVVEIEITGTAKKTVTVKNNVGDSIGYFIEGGEDQVASGESGIVESKAERLKLYERFDNRTKILRTADAWSLDSSDADGNFDGLADSVWASIDTSGLLIANSLIDDGYIGHAINVKAEYGTNVVEKVINVLNDYYLLTVSTDGGTELVESETLQLNLKQFYLNSADRDVDIIAESAAIEWLIESSEGVEDTDSALISNSGLLTANATNEDRRIYVSAILDGLPSSPIEIIIHPDYVEKLTVHYQASIPELGVSSTPISATATWYLDKNLELITADKLVFFETSEAIDVTEDGYIQSVSISNNVSESFTVIYNHAKGSVNATVDVTFYNPILSLDSVVLEGSNSIDENSQSPYSLLGHFSDADTYVVPEWSIIDNSQNQAGETFSATISDNGILTTSGTLFAPRSLVVTAHLGFKGVDHSDTLDVTVNNSNRLVTGLVIDGPVQLNESTTSQYMVTATFDDGGTAVVTPVWHVDTGAASVNLTGLLTAGSVAGNEMITLLATYSSGGVTKTENYNVELLNVDRAINQLYISGPAQIVEGSVAKYTAVAQFDDGTEQVVPLWSLTDNNSTDYSPQFDAATGLLTAPESVGHLQLQLFASFGGLVSAFNIVVLDDEFALSNIERVSLDNQAIEGDSNSYYPVINSDGRYVAFQSTATNFSSDVDSFSDVFVHDRFTKQIEKISVTSDGMVTNGHSVSPDISADGRFVVFASSASNLVETDFVSFEPWFDIFVRDRELGTTEIISLNRFGLEANESSVNPKISQNGRFVVFASRATDLVASESNVDSNVFLFDRETGFLQQISDDVNGGGFTPSISADGSVVAYRSNDNGSIAQIYLYFQTTKTTVVVSSSNSIVGNDHSRWPSVSADGNFVVYESKASNLDVDNNSSSDIFVYSVADQENELVSTWLGAQGNSASFQPSINHDGSIVVFNSVATNFYNDVNGLADIFLLNRKDNTGIVITDDGSGVSANASSGFPVISGDGLHVAFHSRATNLVLDDLNAMHDIFVRSIDGLSSSGQRIWLVPSDNAVAPGASFTVDVYADFMADNTIGGGIDISYESQFVEFSGFTFSEELTGDVVFHNTPTSSFGSLVGLSFGDYSGVTGSVKIGSFTFNALAEGGADINVIGNSSPYGGFYSADNYLAQAINYHGTTIGLFHDVDADGMSDSWELLYSRDLCVDGVTYGVGDPNADCDGDGIINIQEFNTFISSGVEQNPVFVDSDSDGLPDVWEITYGLNPFDDSSAYDDVDGDGIYNIYEYEWGSDPKVNNTGAGGSDFKKDWVKTIGGNNYDEATHSIVDNQGNVYVSGSYSDDVYFNGDADLKSSIGRTDIFITKYTASGDYLWTKVMGGIGFDFATGLAVDDANNVYIFGVFDDVVDFNPGTGEFEVYEMTAMPDSELFVTKLTSNGDYVWSQQLLGTDDASWGRNLAVDAVGNVYVTALDYAVGSWDPYVYVTKLYAADGEPAWRYDIVTTSEGRNEAHGVVLDASGNVYVAGTLGGETDYLTSPGDGGTSFRNAFLMRLDPVTGDPAWQQPITMGVLSEAESLEVSGNHVYIGGNFRGKVDFDPTSTVEISRSGSHRGFVAKYDLDGNYVWSRTLGDYVYGIGVASNEDVYVAGDFYGASLFDSLGKTDSYKSGFNGGVFITKFQANGDYVKTLATNSDGNIHVNSLSISANDDIYLTGSFRGGIDFDPTDVIDVRFSQSNSQDFFLLKLKDDAVDVAWTSSVGVTASGSSITSTASDGWGGAGASSQQVILADGAAEFRAVNTNSRLAFGLSSVDIDASYDSIDYAIYADDNATVQVYESGVAKGVSSAYESGDVLRVERTGTTIAYKRNGAAIYTSAVPSSGNLITDSAVYSSGGQIADALMYGAILDFDGDLIDDDWETANGLNPSDATDADLDGDVDGLTNLQEYQNNTDPSNWDSDADGMADGWEVQYGLNPLDAGDAVLDPDADGLSNLDEYAQGSNPELHAAAINFNYYTILDFDAGVQDVSGPVSVENGGATLHIVGNRWKKIVFPYSITADTVLEFDFSSTSKGDVHGIGFTAEIDPTKSFKVYGTQVWGHVRDAYNGAGAVQHFRIPVAEYLNVGDTGYLTFINDHDVASPNAESYFSNVRIYENDLDLDGIPDSWETANGLNPNDSTDADLDGDTDSLTNLQEYDAGTDPNNWDSDADGIADGWEVQYGLNPLNAVDATLDSDADGITNLAEFQQGGNPNNAAPMARAISLTTEMDTPISSLLHASDAEGDALTFSIVTNGLNGSAVITDATSGAFTYTPNAGVTGTDSFTYMVIDGQAESAAATVSITVNSSVDLAVTQINGPATAVVDQNITVSSAVKNSGTGDAGNSDVGFYLVPQPVVFFDDFESGTLGGWSALNSGAIAVTNDPSDGWVLRKTVNGDPNGGKALLTNAVSDFDLTLYTKRLVTTTAQANRYSLTTESGSGYGLYINFNDISLNLERRNSWSATTLLSSVPLTGGVVNGEWYTLQLTRQGDQLTANVYVGKVEPAASLPLATISATDAAYNDFTQVNVNGGFDYDTDDVRVVSLVKEWPTGGSEIYLGERTLFGVAQGVVDTSETSLIIPNTVVPGSYALVARADLYDTVNEIDETNNTLFSDDAIRILIGGVEPGFPEDAFGVTWVDLVGVTTSANTLTSTIAGWTGAASQQVIKADGAVEFTAVITPSSKIIGLSNINVDNTLSSIDYGLLTQSDASILIFESGNYVDTFFDSYQNGDVLRIERVGTTVVYKVNGAIIYTSTVASSGDLIADASVYELGAQISDAMIYGAGQDSDADLMEDAWETANGLNPFDAADAGLDGDTDGLANLQEYQNGTDPSAWDSDGDGMDDGWEVQYSLYPLDSSDALLDADGDGINNLDEYLLGSDPTLPPGALGITWVDLVGAIALDNILESTVQGWGNSGAASQEVIPGDGAVEFSMSQTGHHSVFGFSNINADASYTSIAYAIYPLFGNVHIYENGVYVGLYGSYQIGDVFRIERIGATVVYKHNGAVVYTSAVPSSGNLIADAAFRIVGSQLVNSMIYGVQ